MKIIQALVVEDHPVAQKMAVRVLESLHCKVDVADDGKTAIDKIQHQNYDLIFIDIGLPDIDGCAVTLKIREYEKATRHSVIVALTSSNGDEEKAKALAAGMDDFYGKPLTEQIAQKIIAQYIKL